MIKQDVSGAMIKVLIAIPKDKLSLIDKIRTKMLKIK